MQMGEAIVLGLTQGLTEFLPVSSSGHLFMVRRGLGLSDEGGLTFDTFLHLGTLAAVGVYYWPVWLSIVRSLWRGFKGGEGAAEGAQQRALAGKLVLATMPAALAGYWGQEYVEALFRSPVPVALGLIFTALALLIDVLRPAGGRAHGPRWRDAIMVGLSQVLALVPGISRSGITIVAGRASGLSRSQAVFFSFLLSAPIIAGAGVASLMQLAEAQGAAPALLLAGFASAFLSGLLAIAWLVHMVERLSLVPFTLYLLAAAAALLYVA